MIYFSGTDMCAVRILLINERSSLMSVASPFSSLTAVVRSDSYAATAAALSSAAAFL